MGLVINNYERLMISLGLTIDEDKDFMESARLEDTPKNRLKILNKLILVALIIAPVTLLYLLAAKLQDGQK